MNHILIFIGARGGSKGVKGKNIRLLNGKPLIAHTIKQALAWNKGEVVVSTDSEEIAAIAKKYGAHVPFLRPTEMATDTVSKGPALRHALQNCEKIFKKKFDVIVDLQATSPIRKVSDLDACLEIYRDKQPKTLFSVVESHDSPYFNLVEKKPGGRIDLVRESKPRFFRRQDAPKVYALNGSIYFFSRDYVLSCKDDISPFSDDAEMYVMDEISKIDIDGELDFQLLEFLISQRIVVLE